MKTFYNVILCFSIVLLASDCYPQSTQPNHMLRIHEDNDFFNLIGERTDNSYTNGTRIDFFQRCTAPQHNFLYRKLPTAGDSSNNICGWSIAQLMATPNDITTTDFQEHDYRYAGALFVTHSFLSFNPSKRYSLQYEVLAGLRGPDAMAKQTQTAIHKMIGSDKPLGWSYELDTQLLINFTVTIERNLLSYESFLEINYGVQARVGSLMDAVLVYPVIRVGKMSPYFDGFLTSNPSKGRNTMQYYFIIKPTGSLIAYNAMLDGQRANSTSKDRAMPISNYVGDIQMGFVLSYGNVGASYLLTRSSTYDKGLYEHRYGTVQVYVRW